MTHIVATIVGVIIGSLIWRNLTDPTTWLGIRWYTLRHRNHIAGSVETHSAERHLIEVVYRGHATREWVECDQAAALERMKQMVAERTGVKPQ